jgi:hypothetical protein
MIYPPRTVSASAVPANGWLVSDQVVQPLWRIDAACAGSQRRALDQQQLQKAIDLRHHRLHMRHIALLLAAPFATVARILSSLGLGRLLKLEPKPPVQRYEWERPGDLLNIDVKTLARFRKPGHRISGDRQKGLSYRVG